MKKALAPLIVSVVLALVGYVVAGPFITIHQIRSAIAANDPELMSSNIDFPTLRANLKEQFNAVITESAVANLKDNAAIALGAAALASKLAESAVDAMVTPSVIANMMTGRLQARSAAQPAHGRKQARSAAEQPHGTRAFQNARYTYDSASKFSVWVSTDNPQDPEVRFVLTRYGLSWKLSNIVIPPALLASGSAG